MKLMKSQRGRRCTSALFLLLLLPFTALGTAHGMAGGPKTYNLYIRNYYEPGDALKLSKFDVLGLDVDTPFSVLNEIRSYNPSIKLLAYIPINGTYENAILFPAGSKWREMWEACQANNWWLRNTQGGHIYDHEGKWSP
jgi:hypothetical protein